MERSTRGFGTAFSRIGGAGVVVTAAIWAEASDVVCRASAVWVAVTDGVVVGVDVAGTPSVAVEAIGDALRETVPSVFIIGGAIGVAVSSAEAVIRVADAPVTQSSVVSNAKPTIRRRDLPTLSMIAKRAELNIASHQNSVRPPVARWPHTHVIARTDYFAGGLAGPTSLAFTQPYPFVSGL